MIMMTPYKCQLINYFLDWVFKLVKAHGSLHAFFYAMTFDENKPQIDNLREDHYGVHFCES